ncbi:sulfotransferase [Peribacillus frigoritolerans]
MDLMISSATHRSGSTLLQRIFNARKETLIWGENGGCLTDFYKVYHNALYYARHSKQHREDYFNSDEDPNHWIATMTPPEADVEHTIIQTVKNFHEGLYTEKFKSTHDLIGYKEVRYGKEELNLLRKCYPDCTIVLLVRNPVDVWKSVSRMAKAERYGTIKGFSDIWNRRAAEYKRLSSVDKKAHLVRYEDIVNRDPTTMNVIKQIGHLKDQQIHSVLKEKISSSSRPITFQQEQIITKQCNKMMRNMGYLQ